MLSVVLTFLWGLSCAQGLWLFQTYSVFSRVYCAGKTFLIQWEHVVRYYPGTVGILVAFVGWVAMLVAVTSKPVGLMVILRGISYLGAK